MGLYSERNVPREMAEFLGRFDAAKDGIWLAVDGDKMVCSVFIDGVDADIKGEHLRWYIVSDDCRGRGIGKFLL